MILLIKTKTQDLQAHYDDVPALRKAEPQWMKVLLAAKGIQSL